MSRARASAHVDPLRDWLVLMGASTAILLAVLLWNLWTFGTVASGGIIGSAATNSPAGSSISSLDTVRSILNNRAAEEAKYEGGTYSFSDPSQ